jgi:hypothetical protein
MCWPVVFYMRDDGTIPAAEFLDGCPTKVEATLEAVLTAVSEAPPPSFSGGGKWEAMHGEMGGYYEVRVTGPGREQFRLFCILEREAPGVEGPVIAVITGLRKPHMTVFGDGDYAGVRRLGDEYRQSKPRRIAT